MVDGPHLAAARCFFKPHVNHIQIFFKPTITQSFAEDLNKGRLISVKSVGQALILRTFTTTQLHNKYRAPMWVNLHSKQ